MSAKTLLSALFCTLFVLIVQVASAQDKTITGKITDSKDGSPVVGASVQPKGTKTGTSTKADGTFSINVGPNVTTLVISSVGYDTQEISITGQTSVNVSFVPNAGANLNEIVVTGYGTARKKDLTGSVGSVKEKDFNKGTFASADQLIQGKVAGVQILNNSGQPGGASTIKIRGNSTVTGTGQPLFVVDGVPLDGSSPRPGVGDIGFGGSNPASNPLNFLNPGDITSIDVLKDASATAIYGSRGAYGVVLITTKRGKSGEPRIEAGVSFGVSSLMKKIEVLNASQFREALSYYGVSATLDKGGNVDALDAILRNASVQNYSVAISGGNDAGRYRLSLNALNQQGIVLKSGIKKYTANLNANFKFLESKKLGLDINIVPSHYIENIAPISNNAGAGNNIIGMALTWNPTQPLKVGDSTVNVGGNSIFNPLNVSDAINDKAKVTTVLASIAPYFKLTSWLEYKLLYSINYGTGNRRTMRNQNTNLSATSTFTGVGFANIANSELITQQLTHTLSADKKIGTNLNLNAVIGYEYLKFKSSGSGESANGPAGGFGQFGIDYTNYIQYGDRTTYNIYSYYNPINELQSYFARAIFNYKDKYLLTGTFRADGSTKFGADNKYGYFPSFAAAWNITKEDFFKVRSINSLKLRAGWGKTGNQEFPSGSAVERIRFGSNGASAGLVNYKNESLKWQSDRQYNIGLDGSILNNRVNLTIDYYNKKTTDLLFPVTGDPNGPGSGAVLWKNLDGFVQNSGVELSVNATIINQKELGWDFGVNVAFNENNVDGLVAPIYTGELNGQGVSGTLVQTIQNGLPINAFYTRKFLGMDKATGLATYQDDGNTFYYVGNPNPKTILGLSTTLRYTKLSLTINMNGAFGQSIYNNTLNNTINVGNINGGRNIALSVLRDPVKESFANPVTSSSRFIEKGNYVKMSNATLNYALGNIGKTFKGANLYVTGQNLFVITKFSGFDPEVNVNKGANFVPSVGFEYQPYPSARTISIGLNFSL
ncbi:MAG TPA: SusC/RagA family TonB-linked outer membrane protein [Chitinophagaceae bacterium]